MCIAIAFKLLGSDDNTKPKWVNLATHCEIAMSKLFCLREAEFFITYVLHITAHKPPTFLDW